jgi:hypothetical protein
MGMICQGFKHLRNRDKMALERHSGGAGEAHEPGIPRLLWEIPGLRFARPGMAEQA